VAAKAAGALLTLVHGEVLRLYKLPTVSVLHLQSVGATNLLIAEVLRGVRVPRLLMKPSATSAGAKAESNLVHNLLGWFQELTAFGHQMGKVEVWVIHRNEWKSKTRYVIRMTT